MKQPGSGMVTPDKPKAVQRSLLRNKPAQQRVLSPERARAMNNLLSSRHTRLESHEAAGVAEYSQAGTVSGCDRLSHAQQAQPSAPAFGHRPGSASSTVVAHSGSVEQQTGPFQGRPAPPCSPFASVANHLDASDALIAHEQGGHPAGVPTWPQSRSSSKEMLHQGDVNAPGSSRPLLQQHASSPTAPGLPTADALPEAAVAHDQLDESRAGFPIVDPPAAAGGSAASDALAQAGLPTGASADEALQDRPASAFAPVADLPAPMDWQVSKQHEPLEVEQAKCAELPENHQQVGCAVHLTMPGRDCQSMIIGLNKDCISCCRLLPARQSACLFCFLSCFLLKLCLKPYCCYHWMPLLDVSVLTVDIFDPLYTSSVSMHPDSALVQARFACLSVLQPCRLLK